MGCRLHLSGERNLLADGARSQKKVMRLLCGHTVGTLFLLAMLKPIILPYLHVTATD